jgi:glucose/arabinose dehydrogenase/mono/diheme cytochrome c family protein
MDRIDGACRAGGTGERAAVTRPMTFETLLTRWTQRAAVVAMAGALAACAGQPASEQAPPADESGLVVPEGFEVDVVHEGVGRARHLAVSDEGFIYVKLRVPNPKGLVALQDTTGDGKADVMEVFGDYEDTGNYGTAMRIHDGYIYFSTAGEVYRQKLVPGRLVPDTPVETILDHDYSSLPRYEHIAKAIAFDGEGHMYVGFGAPGDSCQEQNRRPGAPGQFPCPELEWQGGVWQFDANRVGQTQQDGRRYATGIRSIVAMAWNHQSNDLYALQHGRDDLYRSWSQYYSRWQSAVLPSEEFFRVTDGFDGGWPYYYYDHMQGKKLLNPEYGGDGTREGDGAKLTPPLIGFPGHWAPNDLLFYTGDQFPERYRNGAFIAFHGSTIRMPYSQAGYFVAFVPFENGEPSGPWEVFADNFAGVDPIVNTSDAEARPMGLAQGPDGSLYVSDSVKGKIWRIRFTGDRDSFGPQQLARTEARREQAHIRTPDEEKDVLGREVTEAGAKIYATYCVACHQADGKGDAGRFPPLTSTRWVSGSKARLIDIVLNGLEGEIEVEGKMYNGVMPGNNFLSDEEVSQLLTYLRQNFGNHADAVTPEDVARVRANPPKRRAGDGPPPQAPKQ